MDLLKKEMERKKKALEEAKKSAASTSSSSGAAGAPRFLKAAELRKLQEEREEELRAKERSKRQRLEREDQSQKKQRTSPPSPEAKEEKQQQPSSSSSPSTTKANTKAAAAPKQDDEQEALDKMAPEEVTIRLRSMGLPVRLFGELTTDEAARLDRLQKALVDAKTTLAKLSEMDEFRLGKGHSIRNPFLQKQEEASPAVASVEKSKRKDDDDEEEEQETEEDKKDPHKRIFKYFKGLLRQWEDDLVKRPESVKKSVAGKNETKTLMQCKDYIRPLFKLCKSRKLEESLLNNIVKIVDFCEQGEFVKAHDV